MTKRQQIVAAFVTAMQGVTGMATRVHIAKDPATIADRDLPCIIVKDGRADTNRDDLDGNHRHRLTIEASYWATGVNAWQTVQDGLDAMLTAFDADPTLGGLVVTDELTGHEVFTAQAGTIEAAGLIEFALTYYTNRNEL